MTTTTDPGPDRLHGRRSSGVWAAVAGVGVIGVILAYFLYAYFYLSVTVDEWPPAGTPEPPLLRPLVLVGILVLSAFVALWAGRPLPDRDDQWPVAAALGVVAITGAVVLVLGVALVGDLGLQPRDQAYGAIVTTLHGLFGAVTAAGVVIAGLTAYETHRLGPHPWVAAATAVASVWWCAVVVGWIVVFGVVYVWPQLS